PIRGDSDFLGLAVRIGYQEMAYRANLRLLDLRVEVVGTVAKLVEQLAICGRRPFDDRVGTAGHDLHPMTRGKREPVRGRGGIPERRIRLLLRCDLDRRTGEFIALAAMRNLPRAQSLDDHFERFLENFPRLKKAHAEMRELIRRDAAPHTHFEASAAQLIEHANFL